LNERIASTCAALGLQASPAQIDRLRRFLDLLERWNAAYNLTAIRDPDSMLTQHLADCLALIAPLARWRSGGRLLDVGTGGGLPGVVIAVMLPGWDVSCCDAVGKKVAFVRQVAGALALTNLHAEHTRVEALAVPAFDAVVSRAFASLSDFTRLTRGLLAPDGVWIAMKGRSPDEEIGSVGPAVDVFHVEQLAVPGLDAERCLVWMRPAATQSALRS
jgi:16S rRNA (guanine527-N7)-methyltransferase